VTGDIYHSRSSTNVFDIGYFCDGGVRTI
jgi:hypothetical protein